MSSWWQKKLLRYGLRYGLARTGFLDEQALDLDNLDISLGKRNVIELRDIGLNIAQITKLAQLPPGLRLETARILSLRLIIPADFYQSSIVAEVDGVDLVIVVEEEDASQAHPESPQRSRSPTTLHTPPHRKTNRRIHSPSPRGSRLSPDSDDETYIPTTQEVARSFLRDEPAQELRELEAAVTAQPPRPEGSSLSESSDDSGDVGTGVGVGIPGFLSAFLQGIVNRFQLDIKNVQVRLEMSIPSEGQNHAPVTLRLKVGAADLGVAQGQIEAAQYRTIKLQDVSVALLSEAAVLAEFFEAPSNSSHAGSKWASQSSQSSRLAGDPTEQPSGLIAGMAAVDELHIPGGEISAYKQTESPLPLPLPTAATPDLLPGFISNAHTDDLVGKPHADVDDPLERSSVLDIRPGEDNISWGSRRSQTSAPAEDLWRSMETDEDLPESLIFEPERFATSLEHSTRSSSPLTSRRPRATSPYERAIQGPGSWPEPDEISPYPHPRSPRTWPTSDRRQHDANLSLADPGPVVKSTTDNMQDALARAETYLPAQEILADSPDEVSEELLESKFFDHHQAQSMYMSAMTGTPQTNMPGAWGPDVLSDRSASPITLRTPVQEKSNNLPGSELPIHTEQDANPHSGIATPRAHTPGLCSTLANPFRSSPLLDAREILHVDSLTVSFPTSPVGNTDDNDIDTDQLSRRPAKMSSATKSMPGTFSAYSEMSRSQYREINHKSAEGSSVLWQTYQESPEVPLNSHSGVRLDIGSLCGQLDVSTTRILYTSLTKIVRYFKPSPEEKRKRAIPPQANNPMAAAVQINSFSLSLHLRLETYQSLHDPLLSSKAVVHIAGQSANLNSASDMAFRLGSMGILLGGAELLRFVGSVEDGGSQHASVISVDISTNRITSSKRPIMDVSVRTSQLQIKLDTNLIDESCGSLGALSGMMELGNSMFSDNGNSSPVRTKPLRSVRFATKSTQTTAQPELKINMRIGGVAATLHSRSCSLNLKTDTMKTVYREKGAVVTFERLTLNGPYAHESEAGASLSMELTSLRVDYLTSPQDKDLERLLSLLTPSGDKYETDDDILVDTLLRQRRKGAVLRATIGDVKFKIAEWQCIASLSALANDMKKLSAVAKYLPEDDRPGLLSLVRIKGAEVQIPVNKSFGLLRTTLHDLHLAHVGLPALLAFSIGGVTANQLDGPVLVQPLFPFNSSESLPTVMGRMMDNAEDPTMKVKLFNLCAEYSVPVIVALTASEQTEPQELFNAVSQSIMSLAFVESTEKPECNPGVEFSRSAGKTITIDLLVHESAIGLSPQNLRSKALLLFTNAHVSTQVPPEKTMHVGIGLRRASLLVTEHFEKEHIDPTAPEPPVINREDGVANHLARQGFVTVASVMSAQISFQAKDSEKLGSKAVEVDVRNELLLLETCADSTQTLFATLGALSPPSPPSSEPKYLTQPVPIEDLVNSFTGDAVPQYESQLKSQIMFDVEDPIEGSDTYMRSLGSSFHADEHDGVLAESEITGSLYGPVNGLLEMDSDREDESALGDDYHETAESLLEEDPFEMTVAFDSKLGDAALMRDLSGQCKPGVHGHPIDLGLYEIEHLGYDTFVNGQQALRSRHGFPTAVIDNGLDHDIPIRLRLRNFHVIWNLYDGYDWQRTRDGIAVVVEQVEQKADERRARRRQSREAREDEESIIGDILFNSIYIGVPTDRDAQELRRQINRRIDENVSETASIPASGMSRPTTLSASGQPSLRPRARRRLKLGRSKSHKIAFELKGVSADVLLYPPGSGEHVSSLDLRVADMEIFDNIPTSTWRKFLTHRDKDPGTREMSKPMFHIQVDTVKTLRSHSAVGLYILADILPLRLHVDQDAQDFITRFFAFKDDSVSDSPVSDEDKPYVVRIEVHEVELCLDYKPKNLDYAGLRAGKTSELMNIITLDAADIKLRHLIDYGVGSIDNLQPRLNDMWVTDVVRNQLPTVMGGLAPIRNIVNLGIGVRDVVAIPVKEYKKDGRVFRSIQKGAMQFGKTTTSELARLGAKVALGTQKILSNAEEMLSPTAASLGRPGSGRGRSSGEGAWHEVSDTGEYDEPERRSVSVYADQPLGLFAGLRSARRLLEHDLLTARDALIAVQGDFLESRTPGEAAGAVARHVPTVILRPVIGATRAMGTTLLGVGNAVDRGNLRKADDKYKRR